LRSVWANAAQIVTGIQSQSAGNAQACTE
jgi:hypothetical protein